MDATANRAAALPRTTIRRTVWPTPGTKNAGVIPSSATIAYNAMKPRTPPYAKIRIDLRIFALFCVEGPRDHVLLTTWKMDATSAPVFDIVIAGFGPGMFLFVLGKCHRPVVRSLLCNRPSRTSGHETFIICEWRRNLDTMRGDIILPQTLVMVTATHFQYNQGFSHGRLDFYWLKRDDAIDQEA